MNATEMLVTPTMAAAILAHASAAHLVDAARTSLERATREGAEFGLALGYACGSKSIVLAIESSEITVNWSYGAQPGPEATEYFKVAMLVADLATQLGSR